MRNVLALCLLSLLCRPGVAGSGAHGEEIEGRERLKLFGRSIVTYCINTDGVDVGLAQARAEIETALRDWREAGSARGQASPEIERVAYGYRLKLQNRDGLPYPVASGFEFLEWCWDRAAQPEFRFQAE